MHSGRLTSLLCSQFPGSGLLNILHSQFGRGSSAKVDVESPGPIDET
jgi:hypothetical protein